MKLSDLFQSEKRPNLLFIMTDQERAHEHFPRNFQQHYLPAMTRLKENGVSFTHAYTPTCMCSPSRATFLTSTFPSIHGVTSTGSPQPQHSLPTSFSNLATVLRKGGYSTVEWQGKWHLGNSDTTTPLDYGFTGWNPPDAGNYLTINNTLGGGTPNNDGRFLSNVLEFLQRQSKNDKEEPWCLVVSFVNPHDVYVAQYSVEQAGYSVNDLHSIEISLPSNCNEDLTKQNKPRAQEGMHWKKNHAVVVIHEENTSMQEYCNFYAHLHKLVDSQILEILNTLDGLEQTENTVVIRFADHGEQALSHGLVQKFFNVYEESIHIPFVISNPKVYSSPSSQDDSIVSLLDLVPTIADLLGVSTEFQDCFHGKSLVSLLDHAGDDTSTDTDESILHFTYDDIPCPNAPSIIRCIRTHEYKYAVYFVKDGSDADWELYNLTKDPNENENLAGRDEYASIQFVLEETLQCCMRNYKTMPTTFTWPPVQTDKSRGGPPPPQCES